MNECLSINKGILNFIKSLKSSPISGTKYMNSSTPLKPQS